MKKTIVKIIIAFCFITYACNKENDNEFTWPESIQTNSDKQITNNNSGTWDFHPRWSKDGNKIAFARYYSSNQDLTLCIWDKATQKTTELIKNMYGDCSVSWNPDNTRIAIDVRDKNEVSQIYIVDINNGDMTNFTNNNNNSFRPSWSNDGKRIVYRESGNLYIKNLDGKNLAMIPGTYNATNPLWSSDDSKILFSKESSKEDIYCINPDGTGLTLLAEGNSLMSENWGTWSPDNNKIVYHLFYNGISRIAVKNLISDEINLLLEKDNCRFPDWSPDGKSVVYSFQDNLWILNF